MNRAIFDRMSAGLRNRVQMMVARAVVQLVDDEAGIQAIQLSATADELVEGAERLQDYGFTSVPLDGAEAAVVFPGGLRSHGLVVAVGDRRYRLKGLKAGEVAMYDDQGQSILIGRDGIIITSAKKVTIEAPSILLDGDVDLGGEGGQRVARHNDAVVGGRIVATTSKVMAA